MWMREHVNIEYILYLQMVSDRKSRDAGFGMFVYFNNPLNTAYFTSVQL